MTTNTTTPTPAPASTTPTHSRLPKAPNWMKNSVLNKDWLKDHVFSIGLLIASVVMLFVLVNTGWLGVFVYDDTLAWSVFVFNLVIMAWPAIRAIKTRQHSVLRIVIIAVTVLFTFPLFNLWPMFIRGMGGTVGYALWQVPFFGPVVCTVGAVLLHALAAYFLSHQPSSEDDEQVKNDKESIEGVEATIPDLRAKKNSAEIAHTSAEDAEKDADTEYERLQTESDKSSKKLDKKQAAYDKATAVVKLTKAAKDLASNEEKAAKVRKTLEELQDKLKNAVLSAKQKTEFERQEREASDLLDTLITDGDALRIEVDLLTAQVDISPEKRALEDAKDANQKAAKRADKARSVQKEASDQAAKASATHARRSKALETAEQLIKDAKARIDEAQKAERARWRDRVWVPIVLLVPAFLLYPTWYGWVLSTISV